MELTCEKENIDEVVFRKVMFGEHPLWFVTITNLFKFD